MTRAVCAAGAASLLLIATVCGAFSQGEGRLQFRDGTGRFTTLSKTGSFDLDNPFFQSLGTNGRSCGTCHVASDAWSITPEHVQARFWATNAQDPIFRTVDGSVCEESDTSSFTKAKRAYSLLLEKGLIRVKLDIPQSAEFQVISVDDPYHCSPTPGSLSVYRRVLPGTNLRFLSTVMWDGRESSATQTPEQSLRHQIISATTGHAQGAVPTNEQVESILQFEEGSYTAQSFDKDAGALRHNGGRGGPEELAAQKFFLGINDPLGNNPTGAQFNPSVFNIFAKLGKEDLDFEPDAEKAEQRSQAHAAIRRGEVIFNTKAFTISGVAGLPFASAQGTCTTCHDAPNVGDHSVAAPLNIGLTGPDQRTADLPLFTLFCSATNQTIQTTDPGRALTTGKCSDIGKFKGPILRALPARAPYFHNGSAATVDDVVDFYNTRFGIGFTSREKRDLIAFLNTL